MGDMSPQGYFEENILTRSVPPSARHGARRLKGPILAAVGAVLLIGGAVVGASGAEGDAASAAGVAAGAGLVLGLAGLFMARRRDAGCAAHGDTTRLDQLQKRRTRQLVIYPAIMLGLLAQSFGSLHACMVGEGRLVDVIRVLLPVLYGWITPLIVMGWDGVTLANRELDDELTQSMRARSMILAFVVLMAGATIALMLGLWNPAYGVTALPIVLAVGGAAAGLRFAWLDREAERG